MLKIPIMFNSFKAGDFNLIKINLNYKAASFKYFSAWLMNSIALLFFPLYFNILEKILLKIKINFYTYGYEQSL